MLQILIGALAGIGGYFIMAEAFKLPLMATSRAFGNLSRRQRKRTGSLTIWIRDIAAAIAGLLRLNEYKRNQIAADLQTAGMEITPELHIATALTKALLTGLPAIPLFFIFPLAAPLMLVLAYVMYTSEIKGVRERIKRKRAAIDFELPRFVFSIEETLKHNRNVLTILEDYKNSASPEFREELSITVADMKSGNYESALTRLESRVGSPMLSEIVRGLVSVIRGDETELYWTALSIKLADIGKQALRLEAQNVPGKVKRLSMILLFCFVATYLLIIGTEIMNSIGVIFAN